MNADEAKLICDANRGTLSWSLFHQAAQLQNRALTITICDPLNDHVVGNAYFSMREYPQANFGGAVAILDCLRIAEHYARIGNISVMVNLPMSPVLVHPFAKHTELVAAVKRYKQDRKKIGGPAMFSVGVRPQDHPAYDPDARTRVICLDG